MIARGLMIFAFVAGGCSTGSPEKARPTNTVIGAPSGEGEIIVGALSEAAIPQGECGMILWTLEANQPAPIFRLTAGKGAEIVLNGRQIRLAVSETAGASGFGVYEQQSLSGDGVTGSVRVRFGLGFDGGTYLERGLLTLESPSGWRTVIPAAGVAGCRRK